MPSKVFVFVPAFGQIVSATTFLTTHAVQAALAAKGIGGGISTLSFPDIAELRSMAVTIWYDTLPDTSHILFIDADMGFSPDLIFDMLAFGEPVIGCIYPQRKMPLSWAGSGTGEAQAERRGGFMRVEGVGMGCTLIHRDAIRIMLEKMPEMVDTRLELHPAAGMLRDTGTKRLIRCFDKIDIPERGQVSEDLSFCMRWNKCGGSVWAAIGHRMSHVGPFDYAGRYLDVVEGQQMMAVQQAEAAAQMEAAAKKDSEEKARIIALAADNARLIGELEAERVARAESDRRRQRRLQRAQAEMAAVTAAAKRRRGNGRHVGA